MGNRSPAFLEPCAGLHSLETMLYGWLHCTWGDVMILLGSFWFVSLISWNRRWFLNLNRVNLTGFILPGLVYTVVSEWANVQIFKSWGYNELMPVLPFIRVGLTPVLQWMVIPWVTILSLRCNLLPPWETANSIH